MLVKRWLTSRSQHANSDRRKQRAKTSGDARRLSAPALLGEGYGESGSRQGATRELMDLVLIRHDFRSVCQNA